MKDDMRYYTKDKTRMLHEELRILEDIRSLLQTDFVGHSQIHHRIKELYSNIEANKMDFIKSRMTDGKYIEDLHDQLAVIIGRQMLKHKVIKIEYEENTFRETLVLRAITQIIIPE